MAPLSLSDTTGNAVVVWGKLLVAHVEKNLWRGRKLAGAVAAVAVAGSLAASALPAFASPELPAPPVSALASANVSPNPELPQKCGLNLVMVFDMSSSMSTSDVATVKEASTAAVSALQGTATTMGVYSFATFAQQELAATSLASAQGASSVTSCINALVRRGGYLHAPRTHAQHPAGISGGNQCLGRWRGGLQRLALVQLARMVTQHEAPKISYFEMKYSKLKSSGIASLMCRS